MLCRFLYTTLCLAVVLLAFTGFRALAQPCPDLPPDSPSPDTLSISAALDSVQACRLTTSNAERATHLAAASGNRAYVPQLKQIAADYTTISRSVTFNALHALWLLDEPQSYFLQNAQQYAPNARNDALARWMARYSILVMAREPDSTTAAALQPLWESSNDGSVQSAIDNYESAFEFIVPYEAEADNFPVVFRALTLINTLSDGYNFNWINSGIIAVDRSNSKGYLDPQVVWARKALEALADEYPGEVARVIAGVRNDTRIGIIERHVQDLSPAKQQRLIEGTELYTGFREYLENAAFPDEPVPVPSDPPAPLLPGALVVADDSLNVSFSGSDSTLFNGWNHTLDGATKPTGALTHGAFATTSNARQTVVGALEEASSALAVGVRPPQDVTSGPLSFDPDVFVNDVLSSVTDTVYAATSTDATYGSPDDPAVVYAPAGWRGETMTTGNSTSFSGPSLAGTGVLLVDGDFEPGGNVDWAGLVIVRGNSKSSPQVNVREDGGDVRVSGGLLVFDDTGASGFFQTSIEVTGTLTVRYSRAAMELLGPLGLSLPPVTAQTP